MNKEELKKQIFYKIDWDTTASYELKNKLSDEFVYLAERFSDSQNALLLEEIKELKEKQIPESFIEFVDEMKYMVKQYQNSRYSRGQETRDKLSEELDNIMRLEEFRTKDF